MLYACVTTPEKVQLNAPSDRSICRQLGVPISTGKRILKLVGKKRKELRHGVFISSWSQVKSRSGFRTKVDQELRTKTDAWIRSHHHVVHSPISKDTLLICNPDSPGEFIRKSKLILQTSLIELLCDL